MLDQMFGEAAQQVPVTVRVQLDNELLPESPTTAAKITIGISRGKERPNLELPGLQALRPSFQGRLHHGWQLIEALPGGRPTMVMVLYTPETAQQTFAASPSAAQSLALPDSVPIKDRIRLPPVMYTTLFNPLGRPPEPRINMRVLLTGDVEGGRMEISQGTLRFTQRKEDGAVQHIDVHIGGAKSLGLVGKRIVKATRLGDDGVELEIRQ